MSLLLLLCEGTPRAKHVNTCLYSLWEVTEVALRVIGPCYIDIGHLYELNGVKIIVLCALKVEIINVHVFTHQPGLFH